MTSVRMLPSQSNASSLGSHLVSLEMKVGEGEDRIQSIYLFVDFILLESEDDCASVPRMTPPRWWRVKTEEYRQGV